MTPPRQTERSIVEPPLRDALELYLTKGHENERQLSQLVVDLLDLVGDQPDVITYLNLKAAKALNGEHPWQ